MSDDENARLWALVRELLPQHGAQILRRRAAGETHARIAASLDIGVATVVRREVATREALARHGLLPKDWRENSDFRNWTGQHKPQAARSEA